MTLRTRRRPGFRFETQPPPARDVLPRMDIAVFVGFAASGPLHVPVAIEDPTRFQAIFGPDLPLAWNPIRGEQVYAYLGPAVRAFFRCGGQRCHVIRVANIEQARVNRFQLPGMAQVQVNAAGLPTAVFDATVQAQKALAAVYRIIRGPSVLDRVIASDVLVATIICAAGFEQLNTPARLTSIFGTV